MNAFFTSEGKCKKGDFKCFRDVILSSLREGRKRIIGAGEGFDTDHVQIVNADKLLNGGFILSWESDIVNDLVRHVCKNFDRLDMIFIASDSKTPPWDRSFFQLVTLLYMINLTSKPSFVCGMSALTYLYATATHGTRFNILNGPNGGYTKSLPNFPYYSPFSGMFPGGWFDGETGDIYVFDATALLWRPVCNVGFYHAARSVAKPGRVRDDHLLKQT